MRKTSLTLLLLGCMLLLAHSAIGQEITTITFAGWGSQDVFSEIVEAFETEHPNINVDLQLRGFAPHHESLVVEMAANVAPDVFLLSWGRFLDFVEPGFVIPLDDYIARDAAELRLEEFFPPALTDSEFEGKQYGLPWLIGGQPMFYNLDLLQSVGLDKPNASWTWDEFTAMARMATRDFDGDGVREQFGFSRWDNPRTWASLIFGHGGAIFNEERTQTTLNSEPVRKSFKYISDLVNEYRVVPEPGESAGLARGNLAFVLHTPPTVRTMQDAPFEWGYMIPPQGDERQVMIGGNLGLFIGVNSEHKEEAWAFIKFATQPEMEIKRANAGYSPPARRSSYAMLVDDEWRHFAELLSYQMPISNLLYDELSAAIGDGLRDVVAKTASTEAAIANTSRYLDALLAERYGLNN